MQSKRLLRGKQRMRIKTKYTPYELWESVTFVTASAFLLYSLWFQHVYSSVNGAFNFFGIAFLGLLILNPGKRGFYRELGFVFAFLGVILLESLLTARYKAESLQWFMTILKYALPMLVIFLYAGGEIRKLNKILWVIWIATILLAFNLLLHPVVTNTGALSVGKLNVNTLSSFLLLGLMSSLILFFQEDTSKRKRVFLLLGAVLYTVAQVNAASRRGFLVFAFVIGFVLWESVQIRNKNSPIAKVLLAVFIVICGVMIANLFVEKYADTVLVSRLLGTATDVAEGDRVRALLQAGAISLFISDPLFGGGLNSVAQVIGVYSHSLYFELLGCTGIIGTVTLLPFFLFNLFFSIRQLRKHGRELNRDRDYLAMNEIAFCLAVLISGYAVVFIYDMYFYIMIAIIASVRKCMNCEAQ